MPKNLFKKKKISVCFPAAPRLLRELTSNYPKEFYYGTSPNKFFDYLASCLPVITNCNGWVADIIDEYDCGVVSSPLDPKEFARDLIALSRDKNEIMKMKEGTKRAADNFSTKKLVDDFVSLVGVYAPTSV